MGNNGKKREREREIYIYMYITILPCSLPTTSKPTLDSQRSHCSLFLLPLMLSCPSPFACFILLSGCFASGICLSGWALYDKHEHTWTASPKRRPSVRAHLPPVHLQVPDEEQGSCWFASTGSRHPHTKTMDTIWASHSIGQANTSIFLLSTGT